MTTETTTPDSPPEMTKKDVAWLMNALWESLQSPGWTFGNRKDLEKLGEAIFSGKKLKEVDDKLLTRLFPHLKTITLHLGSLLMKHDPEHVSVPPTAQAPAAAETKTAPENPEAT